MALQDPGMDAAAQTRNVIAGLVRIEGPLLPMLHAVQEAFGYVPAEAVPVIADTLNLSRAEVHGVVSFYHDFRKQPGGRHVLKLCRAEACQSVGSEAVAERLSALLGARPGETSADGAITVEPVYCLGLCSCAPAALLDGEPIGRLDDDRIVAIIEKVRG